MSGTRYYNQSTPKYVKGEPREHILAKCKIGVIGLCCGYEYKEEVKTKTLQGYTVDIFIYNPQDLKDRVAVNIDGGYHFASKIQIGKTKTRDYILNEYFKELGVRYVTLTVEDINDTMTVEEIKQKLGLSDNNNNIKK
jgi:very-short-patch-repair endonuclease